MKTLTKIRKWAKENSIEVKESYNGRILLELPKGSFYIQQRESTAYLSIRGWKGNPAGTYIWGKEERSKYADKLSQTEMIKKLEKYK